MLNIYFWSYLLFFSPPPGRSSLFPIDDNLLDDGHGNQGVPGVLGSPNCYPHQNGERIERFSRKVFVGGLPPDIDEGERTTMMHDTSGLSSHFVFFYFDLLFLSALIHCPPPNTDEITSSFRRFGHLVVDWPHKAESKSYFPPKGIDKASILNTHVWPLKPILFALSLDGVKL